MTLPHSEIEPQSETEGLPRYETQPCPGPGPHGVTGSCLVCAGLGVVPAADTLTPVWPEVLAMLRKPLSARLWDIASRAIMLGTPVDIAVYSAEIQRIRRLGSFYAGARSSRGSS